MPLMYAGILTCLDGYMNIAMEQTEVGNSIHKTDAIIGGNFGFGLLFKRKCPVHGNI